jgi:phytoene dehydrogenase-like protein
MARRFDAVVIGAGHQGLVAAVTLAEAGLDVLVLEAAPQAGGAVRSGEATRPGFVHDLFATNLNLFRASRFYQEHAGSLARHGLELLTSRRPYASAFEDGTALGVTTDSAETLEALGAEDLEDARGWRRLADLYRRFSPTLFRVYGSQVPSFELARAAASAARRLGASGGAELVQLLASSCRELLDSTLRSDKAKALIAPWGLHLDFGPDVAGGAVFPLLEAFADAEGGMCVAAHGAQRLVEALSGMLTEQGGTLETATAVRRVLVSGGQAAGVELATGERVEAAVGVVCCATPLALAGGLLGPGDLPGKLASALAGYRFGPATMMVHLALDGPVPWRAGTHLQGFAYVHVGATLDALARTYADALAGRLPDEPLLVVGQTTSVDSSRAPEGRHVLWVQVRALPARILEDREGELGGLSWDEAAEPYADRVLARLERLAPGLGGLVAGKRVLSPADLERHDANLVGGDSLGGSMHLRQSFLLRPAPGMSGYRTPLAGLVLAGASTWPGPGVNAVSGRLAALELLRRARPRLRGARRGLVGRAGPGRPVPPARRSI